MALVEAFKTRNCSNFGTAVTGRKREAQAHGVEMYLKKLDEAIHLLAPTLMRINLLDPDPKSKQQCYYVKVNDSQNNGKELVLRVYHEGNKVIAIEVVLPEE